MSSNNYFCEVTVWLRVTGKTLAAKSIDMALGVSGSEFRKAGSTGYSGVETTQDVWSYEVVRIPVEPGASVDWSAVRSFLHSISGDVGSAMKKVGGSATLWVSLITDLAQGGFDVDAELVALLAENGIALTVSLLSDGLVRDDGADDLE